MAKQKNKFVFVILTVTVFAMLLTFAACSNQESYKITIHPNNGEADIVWDRTKNFPTFEKEGFSVDGLFLDEQLTQPIALGDLQSMELTADIDVWVKWKETVVPTHSVIIHPNNGESDIVWELGDEIPTLKKVGYLFKGFFLDEQFSKEIVLQNLQTLDDDCEVWVKWINCPHEHLSEWIMDKAATCTEKGQRHKNCSDCAGIAETEEISALNHDIEHHEAKAATCTEIGWEAYDTCKRDGCEYTTYVEIPALNHDIEHHEAKAATCTEIGWEAYDTCKRDGCGYTTYVEIPAHSFDESGVCTVCGYFDSGLAFTLNADGESYSVSGIGNFTGTELVIPKVNFDTKPVTSIGNSAFSYCSSLTSVTIPESVTSIGGYAFIDCTSLTNITIPNSVTSIGAGAFSGCNGLTTIIVEKGNAKYHSDGNCLIETESKTMIAGCKTSVIPNDGSVTSIGDFAFRDCTGLTSITIPASVTYIGNSAFSGCTGLTSITIPDSVTYIGNSAFSYCTSLTSITIPNCVMSIRDWIFYGCSGLTSITIPDSVTSIGDYAFYICSGLTSIEYDGTIEQWQAVQFRNNWDRETGEYVVHCTDGTVAKDGTVTKN